MSFSMYGAVFAAAVISLTAAAAAETGDGVPAVHPRCSEIADDQARLACYDAIDPPARKVRAQTSEPQPPAPTSTKEEKRSWFGFDVPALFNPSSGPPQTTPQQFGNDTIPASKEAQDTIRASQAAREEIQSITARVASYKFTLLGTFTVYLDNGQVWQQISGDTDRAHFDKTGKGSEVTISRGFLGDYNLAVNNRIFKVVRVK